MRNFVLLLILLAPGLAFADPVSAVISIAAIAGTGGAVMAGTATLLTGLTFAGAAVSLIGNIGGNEKLARIGAIVSAGAGLANLANSAMTASGSLNAAKTGSDVAGAAETTSAASGALQSTPVVDGAAAAAGSGANALDSALAAEGITAGTAELASTAGGAGAGGAASALDAAKKGADAAGSLSKIGKFVRENKELVKLGGGLVKGAADAYTSDRRGRDQEKYLDRRRNEFNQSVINGSQLGFSINPNAQVTQVDPRDPTRYVPTRGLVNRAAGQGA